MFDVSADSHGGKDLAMNAMTNAQHGTAGWDTLTREAWRSCRGVKATGSPLAI